MELACANVMVSHNAKKGNIKRIFYEKDIHKNSIFVNYISKLLDI